MIEPNARENFASALHQAEIKEKMRKIKNKIAVASGKGGVGKSTISALLAVSLAKRGYKVGVLDADIYGHSIPRIFGVSARLSGREPDIYPVLTRKYKIKIISMQFFLKSDDSPVIWSGPLVGRAVIDFLSAVEWGELDYLIIDLPPGTGDASFIVLNFAEPDGVIFVTTPHEVSRHVVEKAIYMAMESGVNMIGLVENMSYVLCNGEKIDIFGRGATERISRKFELDIIARIPIDTKISKLCEEGRIEDIEEDYFKDFEFDKKRWK